MLYANIVLVGGNARLPGYKKRIAHDLRQLTPSEYEIRVGIDNEYVFFCVNGFRLLFLFLFYFYGRIMLTDCL